MVSKAALSISKIASPLSMSRGRAAAVVFQFQLPTLLSMGSKGINKRGGATGKRHPRRDACEPAKHTQYLQLPRNFAAPAALQEQQQYDTSCNPDQNLHGCAIHDLVSFL